MASNINANNIDGAFPVAGQDNDSQGFRDNFTNAKNNFSYAKSEIEDLQSKVLLKSALNGDILSNSLNDTVLSGAQVLDFSETRVALGTTSGTVTLDHTLGHYQTVTTNGNVTLAFSNWPPAGQLGRIRLAITTDASSRTLTLPAAVSRGLTTVQGISGQVITFPAGTNTYTYEFTTDDAGTTVTTRDLSAPALGYSIGGGAITQITSRTTGVTLNKSSGTITLVSAAGSTSYQTFTVTNSFVAANDVVIVNQKSGTDKMEVFITAVASGSFNITFATTTGTTTEQPVINFVVVKAVAA